MFSTDPISQEESANIWDEVVPIPEGVEREDEEPAEDFGMGALKNSGGGRNAIGSTGLGVGFGVLGGKNGGNEGLDH